MSLGVTAHQLPGALADHGWPVSPATARREYEACLRRWCEEHEALRETTRVAQIRRLESDLARYRGDKKWQAVIQTESLLARVCGHFAPVSVDVRVDARVTVREAIVEVVASLSEEEMDRLVAEEESLEHFAAIGRRIEAIEAGRVIEGSGEFDTEGPREPSAA